MSFKFKATKLIYALAFVYGACSLMSQDDEYPKWLKKTSGVVVSGLAATGLLKAKKDEDAK